MKVLMVGAGGKFAGLVVPELKRRGATVRALIRDAGKEDEVRRHGADEVVVGDLEDRGSLVRAAKGVEGAFHINPAFAANEAKLGVSMVQAAVEAGVRKFTFSGVIHPSVTKLKNHAAKLPVEEALCESGLVFTILQPTMFMQTLQGGWKEVVEKGSFTLPYSAKVKASYVDYRDVAEAAAIALSTDRLDYGTFELCAPGMLSRVELTAIMSEVLGRRIEARNVSFDEWAATARIPEGPTRDGLRVMYEDYDQHGFPGGNAVVLRAVLEREPRGLKGFFQELAQSTR